MTPAEALLLKSLIWLNGYSMIIKCNRGDNKKLEQLIEEINSLINQGA